MHRAFGPGPPSRASPRGFPVRAALLWLLTLIALTTGAAQSETSRIYVRRIEFVGVSGTNDEVLRREMLQLEGAYLNTAALDQSLRRLERLPYVERATATLRPVPGTPDVVDVVVAVTESPARRYGGGGGYSASLLGSLHAYFINENLFGTGQRFSFRVDGGQLRSVAELAYTNPYARPGGVSRTVQWSSRRMSQASAHASELDTRLDSIRLEYGFAPAGPRGGPTDQSLRLGFEASRVALSAAGTSTSGQLLEWIAANGDVSRSGDSTRYTEPALLLEWRRDTRDRAVFPEHGLVQTLSARAALPGGGVQYYLADYHGAKYFSLGNGWTASLGAELGFAAAYGGATTSMPPYLDWFAGGPGTVRGFSAGTLGPRDSLDRPYGGNFLMAGQFEITAPWPAKWRKRLRIGLFLDAGNVFSTENVAFADSSGHPLDYGFAWPKLRRSAGLDVHVLIPLGELRLSYAVPLGADEHNANPFLRDRVDRFQVDLGVDY